MKSLYFTDLQLTKSQGVLLDLLLRDKEEEKEEEEEGGGERRRRRRERRKRGSRKGRRASSMYIPFTVSISSFLENLNN